MVKCNGGKYNSYKKGIEIVKKNNDNMNFDNYFKGDENNYSSLKYGSTTSDVYDWMAGVIMPPNHVVCNIVEVRFKGARKEFYINTQNIDLKCGDLVVVGGKIGGYDVGHVSLSGELVRVQLKKKNVRVKEVIKNIYRKASTADIAKWEQAKGMELYTLYKARKVIKRLDLSMKLTDVDYQGDKSKAAFYYTAEGRVDFRELIICLSETFNIQIEMRQIGLREETNRMGGIGPCESLLCCHTWSTNFKSDYPFFNRYCNESKRQNRYECYIKDEAEDKIRFKSDGLNVNVKIDNKSSVIKALSYDNVIGQDSITRFDVKVKNSKRKKNKNKNMKRKSL